MQEMLPASDTALSTASAPTLDGFAETKPSSSEVKPSDPEAKPSGPEPKPKQSRRHRGIWQEHGKWSASAGKDPVTGLRLRQHGFDSAEAAQAWRDRQRGIRAGRRSWSVRDLSIAECVDASEALALMRGAGFAGAGLLTQAARDYLARHPGSTPTKVQAFYEVWLGLKKKKNRRTRTVQSARATLAPFVAENGNRPLTEIRLVDVERFVFGANADQTRINRGRAIKNFFAEARLRGLIGDAPRDCPCYGLGLPDKPDCEPQPYTVADAHKILAAAWETEDRFHATAYIALGLFAGIRTEELSRLRFAPDGVDIDRGLITISRAKSKKKRARIITMEPVLLRTLQALKNRPRIIMKFCRERARPTDAGSKVFATMALKKFKTELREKYGIAWHNNGLRSSFGTYDFERGGDDRATATKMGHVGDLAVFHDHYRALAQPGDGPKFFTWSPPAG